ncbi:MAG: methyltransferase domain-containing protein [bacterium]|nr:methyltransferase domain-containing protein [bacterium]
MKALGRSLDIGCGQAKKAGAFGVDINARTDADVLADVSGDGLPFQAGSFERIWISHIIEHVESPLRLLEEIHRVGREDAEIEGVTPHFSNPCSFADPTHRHHFSFYVPELFPRSGRARLGRTQVGESFSGVLLPGHRFLHGGPL